MARGNKRLWAIIAAIGLIGGGYGAYVLWLSPEREAEPATVVQTAVATRGDLSITAAGSGTLVPAKEVALAFGASGTVLAVSVQVGDSVQAGDILARVDDAAARQAVAEAEMQVVEAAQALTLAVPEAELAVSKARADLAIAERELEEMLNWKPDETEIEVAKANLVSAQVSYQNAVSKANLGDALNTSVRVSLDQAIEGLAGAQQAYSEAMNPERDWERNISDTRESAAASLVRAQQTLEIAQANYDLAMVDSTVDDVQSAWAQMVKAQVALDDLETPPDDNEITAARNAVRELALSLQKAELALGDGGDTARRQAALALEEAQLTLASAQEALEGTILTAPFAGIVTEVNVEVGETASDAVTAVVLADLDVPLVQFWVEESDMGSVALGNPVNIVFEALPDYTYSGEITQIDPVLVSVANTPAIQSWATIDVTAHPVKLLGDMNADVEVVAGQALNAVLVPVQALRDIGDGQVALFVVLPDGELEMRLVEVGLMDYVSAEIVSGVAAGEVVRIGETAAASGSTGEAAGQTNTGLPMGPGMLLGGGGRP